MDARVDAMLVKNGRHVDEVEEMEQLVIRSSWLQDHLLLHVMGRLGTWQQSSPAQAYLKGDRVGGRKLQMKMGKEMKWRWFWLGLTSLPKKSKKREGDEMEIMVARVIKKKEKKSEKGMNIQVFKINKATYGGWTNVSFKRKLKIADMWGIN